VNCPWGFGVDYVELFEDHGVLYCPGRRYEGQDASDMSTEPVVLVWTDETHRSELIEWPDFDAAKLRRVLVELRELGWIPLEDNLVRLPNGTLQPF